MISRCSTAGDPCYSPGTYSRVFPTQALNSHLGAEDPPASIQSYGDVPIDYARVGVKYYVPLPLTSIEVRYVVRVVSELTGGREPPNFRASDRDSCILRD